MNDVVRIDRKATLDLKLHVFRALSLLPFKRLKTYGRRGYYGRRRAYVSMDLDAILADLPENPVIVDLGANEGAFARMVAGLAGELHAFEPDPETFDRLARGLSEEKNVHLYNAAVGACDGEISFFRGAGYGSAPNSASLSSSIIADHDAVDVQDTFKVPQMGILTVLERVGKPVDLIKMDIEGAEVQVLEALLDSDALQSVNTIIVETHEHCIPSLVDRTVSLRNRVLNLESPRILMDWH